MDLGLAGKVAVVTGGSKGIGLAVSRALVQEGVQVAAGSLHGGEAADGIHPVAVDLSTPQGPADLVDAAVRRFGRVDILVNNVGAVRPRLDGFLAITDDEWQWALTLNFLAAVRACRAAIPHLLTGGGGTIVTIGSVNAYLPDPGVIDYSAAKAALTNFCKALSTEFGPRGIRVNSISPGPVETDLWLGDHGVAATVAGDGDPAAVAAKQAAQAPTGRFTRPDEIADIVLLLAGGRAGNLTGTDIRIDGGLVTTL